MKVLLLLFLATSCNYKIVKDNNLHEVSVPAEMIETVSFEQVKEEVFAPKCIVCHGTAGGVNLESHVSARQHMDAIRKATLESKSMPKAPLGPLNDRQYELLTAWIDAGGPDRSNRDTQGGSPQVPGGTSTGEENGKLSFETIKKEIIVLKCLSCHTPDEQGEKVPLVTREQLLSSPLKLIVPGKPKESLFYTITAPGAINMMPSYPVEPLSVKQRKLVKQWIMEGAN